MECLGRYTFIVMTSVILSGGVKMRDEHGMLREVSIFVMIFFSSGRGLQGLNQGAQGKGLISSMLLYVLL